MLKKLISLLIFLVLLNIVHPVHAITFDNNADIINVFIGENLEYIRDSEKKLTLTDLEGAGLEWQKHQRENINAGVTEDPFWFRFTVRNSTQRQLYLHLDYAQIMEIRLYYRDKKGDLHESISGCRYPQTQREIDYRYYSFRLSDSPEEITYYLYVEPLLNLTIRPAICERDQLFHIHQQSDIVYWLYIGFMLFAVIFNVIFYISTRNRSFLYLILYVFGWMGFHISLGGIAFQYLWPDVPWWEQRSFLVLTPLLGVFAIFFFRTFLETYRQKWIDRIYMYLLLPWALIDLILVFFIPRSVLMQITTIRGVIFTLYNIFVAGYAYFVQKNRSAAFLFTGFIGIPFSIIFMSLAASGLFAVGMVSATTNIIANIWLITLLTVGVSHKFILVEQRAIRSEREHDRLKDAIMDGYIEYDMHGNIFDCNDTFCDMIGLSREELLAKNLSAIQVSSSVDDITLHEQLTSRGYSDVFEKEYITVEHSILPIEFRVYWVREQQGVMPRLMEIVRDVSQRKESEKQLRHSQKLDALGKLAGGIAHDFNNMLAGIMGGAEVISIRLKQGDVESCMKYADIIIDTSQKASRLTNQLLNISRSTDVVKKDIEMDSVIGDVTQLLERTIDKKIEVTSEVIHHDLVMRGDPDRISNALLNIGINARDAITGNGHIYYRVSREKLSKQQLRNWRGQFASGWYIRIEIEDDGSGIRPEHMDQIFDPYFTTKEIGKGTGLGLASVYSTVQEHNGHIAVSSAPGKGSQFTLWFKESGGKSLPVQESNKVEDYAAEGNILLAEDESSVKVVVEELLSSLGYYILAANDGEEVMEIFKRYRQDIDLVLLDVIMPRKSGVEVFEEIRKMDPEVPVVLMSGYVSNVDLEALYAQGLNGFIRKPFDRKAIARQIHNVIHQEK